LAKPVTGQTWSGVRADPGAVLLILRHHSLRLPDAQSTSSTNRPHLSLVLDAPAILEGAADLLGKPAEGFVDWGRSEVRPVYEACLEIARRAEALARHSGLCDPEEAWVGGLLAPLGWLAVCAADPSAAAACLADPDYVADPASCQRRLWGLDQSA